MIDKRNMIRIFTRSLFLILLVLLSCSGGNQKEYEIGMDPTWTPLPFGNREQNVTAFSTELLREICKLEKIAITKVNVSWDNLMSGLQKKQYQAILSAMPPQLYILQTYDFSNLFLRLGPVLVVRNDSTINGLDALQGKEVAVIFNPSDATLLQQAPGVLIKEYMQIAVALNDVVNETIDAAVVDILTATAYCQDLYQGQLKIATPPLTDAGLRLISLHNTAPGLIESFNAGLKKLQASGKYDTLRQKWGLNESAPQ